MKFERHTKCERDTVCRDVIMGGPDTASREDVVKCRTALIDGINDGRFDIWNDLASRI